ncbi:WD40 repeat-like protein [Metschnikowia bicuspidata var. bicuspidata NRRL YB-4993]|uniref:WD40 repeat-like protein n=1 Tax=Metschnikowia bicuspidata var. bicuspidata NRRL YB-4993 TaxID=869754 RepID=A0A1A0H7Z0_9ASCO|nr:WD40 repeat-like protein [Metschnikowia bicuspidata var. bicuspidata NRRL YB-4993]OBA20013.1 WD40 repeat-like protein [Metschnikowia bicuspidata var. bicuspidata NRRL YB-4993]
MTLPGARGRAIEGLVWSHIEGELPRLYSIGGSTYITEWDLTTGRPKANLNCNAGVIWCIDSNASGTKLAVGCDDGTVVVVDVSGGSGVMEYEFICQRQDQRVLGMQWYGDDMLIGGCADGKVRCWAIKGENKGKIVCSMKVDKLKTESTLVWSIVAIPSRGQFVTGDSTGSVKFWDVNTFSLLQTFSAHEADVLSLACDASSERVFSAGIDRKIHQFSFLNNKSRKDSKWIHNYSRLLHLNDVRTLALFESKAYNFLVSGGVERSIIVQSVENFQIGPYKKILMDQQISNISLNSSSKLVALFQDQSVKIWRLADDKHKLVAKVTLSDEDNVTSVSMGDFAESVSILAVATINSVKVFTMTEAGQKLQIKKLRDANFDALISGAKKVIVYNVNHILIHTPEDEIYTFIVNDDSLELEDEVESVTQEGNSLRAGFDHFNTIHTIAMSDDNSKIAVARFNNTVEILPLTSNEEAHTLATLSNTVSLIAFTGRDTLVILTEENKLFEFNILKGAKSLLTPWCQRNSELIPLSFLKLETKPEGIFVQGSKVWIFGNQWLAFFDLNLNLEVNKSYVANSKKRNKDGLSIREAEEFDNKSNSNNFFDRELTAALVRRAEEDDEEFGEEAKQKKSYWITQKYRPVLKVDRWSDSDIIVIEREAFALPTTSAFEAPHLKI